MIFTFRARLQGNDGDKTQIGDNMIAGVTVFDTFLFPSSEESKQAPDLIRDF